MKHLNIWTHNLRYSKLLTDSFHIILIEWRDYKDHAGTYQRKGDGQTYLLILFISTYTGVTRTQTKYKIKHACNLLSSAKLQILESLLWGSVSSIGLWIQIKRWFVDDVEVILTFSTNLWALL